VRVRFVPEIGKNSAGKIITRSIVSDEIFWVELGVETKSAGGGDDDANDDDDEDNEEGCGGGYVDPNA
jgi:hypothetical protein